MANDSDIFGDAGAAPANEDIFKDLPKTVPGISSGLKIGKERLLEDAKKVGEAKNWLEQFATGIGKTSQSAAAGLMGLHAYSPIGLLTNNWLGRFAPNQEALDVAKATTQGAGGWGMGGDIGASMAMGAAVPAKAFGTVGRWSGVGDIGATSGLTTAAITPGDLLERVKQGGISAGLSAALPAALGITQSARRAITDTGREIGGAERLRQEIGAESADKLAQTLQAIPGQTALGTRPTAAMATGNPTLQALELGARTRRGDMFAPRDAENAAARWAALQGVAQDTSTMQAQRLAQTSPLRSAALGEAGNVQGFEIPIAQKIAGMMAGEGRTNPAVQRMGNYVMGELEQGVTPEQVYGIRKVLTTDIPKGTELGSAMLFARKQRMEIVDAIDEAMNKASNGKWTEYLDKYKELSKPIASANAAAKIEDVFARNAPAGMTPPGMTAGAATMARAIDKFGQKEFGSKTFDQLLPQDRATLQAIANELAAQQSVMKAGGIVGSDTAAKLFAANRADQVAGGLVGMAANKAIPGVGGILTNAATGMLAKKRDEALARLLLDPQELARALEQARTAGLLMQGAAAPGRLTRGALYDPNGR